MVKEFVTKKEIINFSEKYDKEIRGNTGRGWIDEMLAERLADYVNSKVKKQYGKNN